MSYQAAFFFFKHSRRHTNRRLDFQVWKPFYFNVTADYSNYSIFFLYIKLIKDTLTDTRVKITEFVCNFHSVYWNTKFDQEEIGLAFLKYWFLLSINFITFPSILYIQISLAPYLFIYFLTNLKNSSIVAWLIFSQAWMKFSIY